MSDSRRRFLKAGMLAALFAAVPLKDVLAQRWKGRDGNPDSGLSPDAQDPLANYTRATFISYLNSVFQLQTVSGVVGVTLLKVDDMAPPKGGECFTLLFRGGSRALRQDTYTIEHPALGTFKLFLVPVGTDRNGAQGYLATINRISYVDALSPVPQGSSIRPGSGTTSSTPSAPAAAGDSPATTAPTSPASVTPNVKKPVKKVRKPSPRKRTDEDDFDDLIDLR